MKIWTIELTDITINAVQDMMFYGGEFFEVRENILDEIIYTFEE